MWSGSRWRPEATKDLRLPPPDDLPRQELLMILQNESRFDKRSCCPSQALLVAHTPAASEACCLAPHLYTARRSMGGTERSACQDCFLVLNINIQSMSRTRHRSSDTSFWRHRTGYHYSVCQAWSLSTHTLHGEHGGRLHKERRRTYMMNWTPRVRKP